VALHTHAFAGPCRSSDLPGRVLRGRISDFVLSVTPPSLLRSPFTYLLVSLPWVVAVTLAVRLAATVSHAAPVTALRVALLSIVVLIAAGVVLLVSPQTQPAHRRAIGFASSVLAPFAALLAVQDGGVHSLAFIASCVCALGATVATGWRGVTICATGALAVVVGAPVLAGTALPPADLVYAAAVVVTVTLLPVLYIARSIQRGTLRTLTELPVFGTVAGDPSLEDALPEIGDPRSLRGSDPQDSPAHIDALGRYLRQVRDTLGVADAVYWRVSRTDSVLVPGAWASADSDRWLLNHQRLGAALISVQSTSRVALFERPDDGAMAAVSVPGGAGSGGVLSLHATTMTVSNEVLARWLPRFAENLGLLAQLLETQAEYGRQSRQSQSLLHASQAFQQHRTIDTLAQAIVEAALTVSGASRAALIRWLPDTSTGVVQGVSAGHHLSRSATVLADSLVGELCMTGLPQVWEDAQMLQLSTPVYGAGHAIPRLGSLSIVPLKQGSAVTGAIVVESDATDAILVRDMRNVRLLGAMASVSLETVWQIEEATLRARTDALTGLANRRAFDEALTRAIAEADRFGHSVGLVICDVDNFKRINDVYGHEVGDHVLRSVATTLSASVRGVDLVARYGGEELVMLLGKADVATAWEVAERMRAAIEGKTIGVGEHLIHVTASFGVASYPESAHAGEELFPAADKALYVAKREGKNCVRFAKPLNPERPAEPEGTSDGDGWKDASE
jgi:diguanylate cyclase (GGDEF)-like protein